MSAQASARRAQVDGEGGGTTPGAGMIPTINLKPISEPSTNEARHELPELLFYLVWRAVTDVIKAHGISRDYFAGEKTVLTHGHSRPFSLELLATTAAHLHKAGADCQETAAEAMALLTACSDIRDLAIVEENEKRSIRSAVQHSGLPAEQLFSFQKGIRLITGQSRLNRAEEDFQYFLEACVKRWDGELSETDVRKAVAIIVKDYEEGGFKSGDVVATKEHFEKFLVAGLIGTKRRPTKKALHRKTSAKLASKERNPASKKRKAAK